MRNKRVSLKGVKETAHSLEQSLISTNQGLKLLLQSVIRSGFKEAIKPYQQMQNVLIQQRLWCRNHRRDELNLHWDQIAGTARELRSIFDSFSAIMKNLENINSMGVAKEQPDIKTNDRKRD